MKKILIITDFIEGQPVIASVRYGELMNYIKYKFYTVVVNDFKYGSQNSIYSDKNFKFITTESKFTQKLDNNQNVSKSNKLIRNNLTLFLWRNYSYSKFKFYKDNKELFKDISEYILNEKIDCIFVTVPDVYGLYIMKYLKDNFPDIPVIVEVRDIINHKIGKGNPTIVNKNAEKIIIKYSDGIIFLSDGIQYYYLNMCSNLKTKVIKNGYNSIDFNDCVYKNISPNKDKLVFAHIGSIYKGRDIKEFIKSLIKLSKLINKEVEFNIVGYLDNEALMDINEMDDLLNKNVKINIIGTISHDKAIEYLKKCDIAVILTHKKGSYFAIPGKTYEYIGACKPIIAVTEDRPLIDLIDKKYGECANHDSDDIVSKILHIIYNDYDFSDRYLFSRKNQANQIINFIEEFVM